MLLLLFFNCFLIGSPTALIILVQYAGGKCEIAIGCMKAFVSLTGLLLYVTFELRSTITASEGEMTAPTIFCNECGASNPLQATLCFACNNALQPSAASLLLQVQAASTSAAVPTSKVRGPLAQSFLLHSRYSIVSQIGTGGFGAVYQAKDTLFSHRLVAI